MKVPLIQDTHLASRVVLVRVDHNVVKKGKIKDALRVDSSVPTIIHILKNGGIPVLMSHVGRPKDKNTGEITIDETTSVQPVVNYLKKKFNLNFFVPEMKHVTEKGISCIDTSINLHLLELAHGKYDGIYLPNCRWFTAEEEKGESAEQLGREFAGLADIFVNDAFGSWQPHVSTVMPAKFIPSFAGLLYQKEIENLEKIFNADKPFLAIVAGSKFDTKIGPLEVLLEKVDHLLLGGVIYNAYLCAKYGIKIKGISEADIKSAKAFLDMADKYPGVVLEPQYIVESDTLDEKTEDSCRTWHINEKKEYNFILDIDPKSFEDKKIADAISNAKTIFTNAVMGLTPLFYEGTQEMYERICSNKNAIKLFGGGDTIQEFKYLVPKYYLRADNDESFYFFTGGGTILSAIQAGTALKLEPVKALIKNLKDFPPEHECSCGH